MREREREREREGHRESRWGFGSEERREHMRKREGRERKRREIMTERGEKFWGIKKYERECIKKLYLFIPFSYSTIIYLR